jgi:hypothetical protein
MYLQKVRSKKTIVFGGMKRAGFVAGSVSQRYGFTKPDP